MSIDALRDIPFLQTKDGSSTVFDVLKQAHLPQTQLDLTQPGYVVTAQLRLLSSVTAVVLRHTDLSVNKLRKKGLPEEAIVEALKDLSSGTNPFDSTQPFLQRPVLPPKTAKDNSRRIGPGHKPIKKLSPSMPPDEAEEYWDLLTSQKESMELTDALLALTVFHNLSMASNNSYDGDKCQMGSPAMRFVGAGYTATEVYINGDTLLDTLLFQIPMDWVEGTGLPAWADRTCTVSLDHATGQAHPLWAATWSSNAPACFWQDRKLTGVRTGGIPEAWFLKSEMGTTKELRKAWWDQRNTRDPFYLYIENSQGELKVQRLDFGVDGTDLAVEWAAENKTQSLLNNLQGRVLDEAQQPFRLHFARHQISGNASSPNIRASENFVPDLSAWAFDIDPDLQDEIQRKARQIQHLNYGLRSVFRRKNSNEPSNAAVLDDLAERKEDASQAFWRQIHYVYSDILRTLREEYNSGDNDELPEDYQLPAELIKKCHEATMEAFDATVNPHSLQEPAQIAYVRGQLSRRIHRILSPSEATGENNER